MNTRQKTALRLLSTAAGIIAFNAAVLADSINVNFHNGTPLSSSDTAEIGASGYQVPCNAWDNLGGTNGRLTTVHKYSPDDAEPVSVIEGATLAVTGSSGTYRCANLDAGSNILAGYVDDNNNNQYPTITITGVPFDYYRVVVYHSTDTANARFGRDIVNGIAFNYAAGSDVVVRTTVRTVDSCWGNAGPAEDANALAEGVNYLVTPVFPNNASKTVTIVGNRHGSNNANRACMAAVQIVEVPASEYYDATAEAKTATSEENAAVRANAHGFDTAIVKGAGENENGYGYTFDWNGTTAFTTHMVFDGGSHTVGLTAGTANWKLCENSSNDYPLWDVKSGTTLTFKGKDAGGWEGASKAAACVIAVRDGATLNLAQYNSSGTFYYQGRFYLEPGATIDVKTDDRYMRVNGGMASGQEQFYVPAQESASGKHATITGANINPAHNTTAGFGIFVGENAQLDWNTDIKDYVSGSNWVHGDIAKRGSGVLSFAKTAMLNDWTGRITVEEGTFLLSQANIFGMKESRASTLVTGGRIVASEDNKAALDYANITLNGGCVAVDATGKAHNAGDTIVISGVTLGEGVAVADAAFVLGSDREWTATESNGTITLTAGETVKKWTGAAGTTDWFTAENWSGNAVPTSSDTILIDADTTVTYSKSYPSGALAAGKIKFAANATLTVKAADYGVYNELQVKEYEGQGTLVLHRAGIKATASTVTIPETVSLVVESDGVSNHDSWFDGNSSNTLVVNGPVDVSHYLHIINRVVINGAITMNTDPHMVLKSTARLTLTALPAAVGTVTSESGATLTLSGNGKDASAYTLSSGSISGPAAITVRNCTLTLGYNLVNSHVLSGFTGVFVVGEGAKVDCANASQDGSGNLYPFGGASKIRFEGGEVVGFHQWSKTHLQAIEVVEGQTGLIDNLKDAWGNDGVNMELNGALTGGGTLTVKSASRWTLLMADNSGFSGTFIYEKTSASDTGDPYLAFTTAASASAAAEWRLDNAYGEAKFPVRFNNPAESTLYFGALTVAEASEIAVANASTTVAIGGKAGVDSEIDVPFTGNAVTLTKTGDAKLTLGAAVSFVDGTAININAGTFDVAEGAALAAADVTLATGVMVAKSFTAKSVTDNGANVPEGCRKIVTATEFRVVAATDDYITVDGIDIPLSWVEEHAGGDETFMASDSTVKAANGHNYFECYALGLDPADAASKPRATIESYADGGFAIGLEGCGTIPDGVSISLYVLSTADLEQDFAAYQPAETYGSGIGTIFKIVPSAEADAKFFKVGITISAR